MKFSNNGYPNPGTHQTYIKCLNKQDAKIWQRYPTRAKGIEGETWFRAQSNEINSQKVSYLNNLLPAKGKEDWHEAEKDLRKVSDWWKTPKGTCKRQHEEEISRENLRGVPIQGSLMMFSLGRKNISTTNFFLFYAFEKDFYAVMHVYFIWRNAPSWWNMLRPFGDAMLCNAWLFMQCWCVVRLYITLHPQKNVAYSIKMEHYAIQNKHA